MRARLEGLQARTRKPGPLGIQDPCPFRAQPQVDGTVHDALRALAEAVEHELNFAGENALIVAGDDVALSNGNPHAAPLANAIDGLRTALAQSAALIAVRRAHQTLDALRVAVATELVVAVRALRLAGQEPVGAGTRPLWRNAIARLNPDLSDRPLHPDIEAARQLLEVWEPAGH
jgi:histidine ammonia-lyase